MPDVVPVISGMAQGLREGVQKDVTASELPGLRAQSAVFLVHTEGLRQALGWRKLAVRRLAVRTGCYHSRSMNVL